MMNERTPDAAAEWEETKKSLQAAYDLLDAAREHASQDFENESKLIETIRMQASALASQKSSLRRYLEYLLLVVCLGLAVQLAYILNQLRIQLG